MDVYIFGAGASAAEGAPTTAQFLARARDYLGMTGDPRTAGVWRFLTTVFEVEALDQIPPVDEIISLVDWCLHTDQGLGPAYPPRALSEVRRDLEYLLCQTLDAAVDRRPHGSDSPHARFAQGLVSRPAGEYALLSLNYDTMLDDALLAAGLQPDYALDDRVAAPLLLKLHGSLNWAHCPACDRIEVAREQVAHLLPRVAGLACSRCGNPHLLGVIISPTWLKRYTLPPLVRVFDQALGAIRRARRIVFAGYSLPPADVAIHQVIRRGLLTRIHQERPVVEVINHRPSDEVVERFTRLFGKGVRFDFSGFRGQL